MMMLIPGTAAQFGLGLPIAMVLRDFLSHCLCGGLSARFQEELLEHTPTTAS